MKKEWIVLACLLVLITAGAVAQNKQPEAFWSVAPSVSLLNGDNAVSQSLSVNGGRQYKHFYAGLGAGIDYYKIRSVPLLAEIRYGLDNRFSPFVFIHGGYNIAWALEHQRTRPFNGFGGSTFDNGIYTGAGLGCFLYKKGKEGLFCTAGYTVKTLTELNDDRLWNGTETVVSQKKTNYTFRRIALTLAYRF